MLERHGKTQLNQSHASFKIRAGRKPGIHCTRQKFTNVLIHLPVKLSGHPEQRPSCLWREKLFRQANPPPYVAKYADEMSAGTSSYEEQEPEARTDETVWPFCSTHHKTKQ